MVSYPFLPFHPPFYRSIVRVCMFSFSSSLKHQPTRKGTQTGRSPFDARFIPFLSRFSPTPSRELFFFHETKGKLANPFHPRFTTVFPVSCPFHCRLTAVFPVSSPFHYRISRFFPVFSEFFYRFIHVSLPFHPRFILVNVVLRLLMRILPCG